MVHALRETWRVLTAGADLLDLRPLACDLPLEVASSTGGTVTGRVGGAPGLVGDIACRRAIARVVCEGLFLRDGVRYFFNAFYWDTLAELEGFLEHHWQVRYRHPSRASLEASGHLLDEDPTARLRVREVLMLARYRRLDEEEQPG